MRLTWMLTVIASLLVTGVAVAQSAVPSERSAKMDRHFAYTDRNGDGYIGRDEVTPYPVLVKYFDVIDSNRDGKISKEEMQAYRLGTQGKRSAAKVDQ